MSNSEALASLTATYTDSDISDDDGDEQQQLNDGVTTTSTTPPPVKPAFNFSPDDDVDSSLSNNFFSGLRDSDSHNSNFKINTRLVSMSYNEEDDDDKTNHSINKQHIQLDDDEEETSLDSIKNFTSALAKTTSDDSIKLPPEPPGRCSNVLQEKINQLYEKKLREQTDMNASIQKNKNFRNPSIYEKLVTFCRIDELGTNYPPEMYDPHSWDESSFYEELAKAQKAEMDKRQKERTKVEFVSGTKKSTTGGNAASGGGDTSDDGKKRKSKWDVAQSTVKPIMTQPPGIVPVTATASGTKATVISAFGTITKKAKQ